MAITATPASDNSIITSNALDLLTCFQDGLDEVVYQMAEDIAAKRHTASGNVDDVIEVDVQDVRAAGERLTTMIRNLVASGQLSPEFESRVTSMGECLDCK